MEYIEIKELVYGESVDSRIIEAILQLELVVTRRMNADRALTAEAITKNFARCQG